MAQHDVTKRVERIAELREQSLEEVVASFNDDNIEESYGEVIAWNKSAEAKVISELNLAEEEATRKRVKANFHWKKVNGDWFVAGDFDEKNIGDVIEVYKIDGTSEEKVIVEFAVEEDVAGLVKVQDASETLDIVKVDSKEEKVEVSETEEILDLKKVKSVLKNKSITYGDIVKATGMSKGAIRPYRIGERPLAKMQIENALKIQRVYDDLNKKKHPTN